MILTPIDHAALPDLLSGLDHALAPHPLAHRVFTRITAVIPDGDLMSLSTDARHHAEGVALCRRFGFGILDVDPQTWFTWDGTNVAARMEPSVLIHEVAHYQCAAPARRHVLDFGLGAGPETGRKAEANAVQTVFAMEADLEEAMSSLLGILWEAELGHPALLGFIEQNWLEGGVKLHNVEHFLKVTGLLAEHRLIDADGGPTMACREMDDDTFFAPWRG